ncbi:MAG: hypothetical protein KDE31_25155, partial [Caldilineaceae bacterium]|nr:hypothetical protein [Caldilineaceae bacterium]
MPRLKVYLLGSPHLTLHDEAITIGRQKALALLCYLALKGEPQRRDTLAALLWPEQSQQQARQALSRHLFALKEALGDGWLDADQETIGMRATPALWLDVSHFRAHLTACTEDKADCRAALLDAVALYRDDFLTGFTLPDCPEFDDWQFFQGEELRQQFAAALVQLIELLVDEEAYDAALPHARRWLALDPLHEPAHQTLMRLYAQSGQQAAALRQYQLCVQTLADELGVPPAAETTALYEQIRTGQRSQGPEASTPLVENRSEEPVLPHYPAATLSSNGRYDWREAPTIERIYGRAQEREQLTNWLVGERCRLISVLGIGGLGKTTLAAQVVREVGSRNEQPFARILWRSLLNAPPLTELLPEILQFLTLPQSVTIPGTLDKRLMLLLDCLTQERCLLVFDNLESLIDAWERNGHFRLGYEEYGQLLLYLGQHEHQSCLLITSREQPQELGRLERSTTAVRSLALTGLSLQAGQEL